MNHNRKSVDRFPKMLRRFDQAEREKEIKETRAKGMRVRGYRAIGAEQTIRKPLVKLQ